MTMGYTPGSSDIGHWLDTMLRRPTGRAALLGPRGSVLAVGGASSSTPPGLRRRGHHLRALRQGGFRGRRPRGMPARIAKARPAGATAPTELPEVARKAMDEAARAVREDKVEPAAALDQALEATGQALGRRLQGWVLQGSSLDLLPIPPELAALESPEIAVSVLLHPSPGTRRGRATWCSSLRRRRTWRSSARATGLRAAPRAGEPRSTASSQSLVQLRGELFRNAVQQAADEVCVSYRPRRCSARPRRRGVRSRRGRPAITRRPVVEILQREDGLEGVAHVEQAQHLFRMVSGCVGEDDLAPRKPGREAHEAPAPARERSESFDRGATATIRASAGDPNPLTRPLVADVGAVPRHIAGLPAHLHRARRPHRRAT